MAVTWKINSLDVTKTVGSLSDVVRTIHWSANDSEIVGSGDSAVTHSGSCYGNIGLAEPDASSFTPYADITEENAITWLKAALNANESDVVAGIEADIAAQITESKSPTMTSGVPW